MYEKLALWGLPQDPQRLLRWLQMNALPVTRWADAVNARRRCTDCGVGIIDLLAFAEQIGRHYSMSRRTRAAILSEMVVVLKESGLEVGVFTVPGQCSACNPNQSPTEDDNMRWAQNWLRCMEVDPTANSESPSPRDLHNLSINKRIPELERQLQTMWGTLLPEQE